MPITLNGTTGITTTELSTASIRTSSEGYASALDTELATALWAIAGMLGAGQTWQNLTASRALATTYTNSTGRPIQVAATIAHNSSGGASALLVDGNSVATFANNMTGTNIVMPYAIIVPSGSTFRVNQTAGTVSIFSWWELR